MTTRTTHRLMLILGTILQAVAAFDVAAIRPYSAGLLTISGALLLASSAPVARGKSAPMFPPS